MIYKIFLSLLIIAGGLSNITDIGKQRKPLTSKTVILGLIVQMLIVLGLWLLV
jgi:hypothetical protein